MVKFFSSLLTSLFIYRLAKTLHFIYPLKSLELLKTLHICSIFKTPDRKEVFLTGWDEKISYT
jgi:hypothetical protein